MDSYGVSFSPTTSLDKSQTPTDPNATVQEAIRTLALRIPKVTGAKGFAPDALMGGTGAQGTLGLDRLLSMLFGGSAPQGTAAPSAPMTPRVTGITDTGQMNDLMVSPETPSTPTPSPAPRMPAPTFNKPMQPGSYSDV
jgi:hypothetical protein